MTSLEYSVLRIANTYDWITATAASRISKRFWAVIRIVNSVCLNEGPLFPSKVKISVLQLCLRLGVLLMFPVGLDY